MAGMTEEEAKHIAKETVKETLLQLGIDCSSPAAALEFQKDMNHVRVWRNSVETVQRQGIIATVTILVSGIGGFIYMMIHGKG